MAVFLNERQAAWLVVDSRACLHGFQAQHIHFLTVPHWLLLNLSVLVFSYVNRGEAIFVGNEIGWEKKRCLMETSSISYLWLPSPHLPGNSILPHLEWLTKKPPLHLHPGKTQPEHSGADLQTLCEAGGRRRADLPAQLHCVRGKPFLESWAGLEGKECQELGETGKCFLCGNDVENFLSV